MFNFFVFIFGLIIGSFLNCLIYYLEGGRKVLTGRSFCPHCQHVLSWPDLIPVLSFLFLHGKCRYCSKRISWQYPLVELSTGILFVLIFNLFGGWLYLAYLFIVSSLLVVIFVYDLKKYLISDKIIVPLIVLTLIFNWSNIVFGLVAGLFFWLIHYISKGRGMGFGDVKLALFLGLFLGWPGILIALVVAFFVGAFIGIMLIISGKKGLKSEIPFGPFLVLGAFTALFLEDFIVFNLLKW